MDGLLKKTVKQFAATTGSATIKSKRKFVKIIIQMSVTHRPLMRAEQPTLEQRHHLMHLGQQMFTRLLLPLNLPIVDETVHRKIRRQAVRTHRAARLDHVSDETKKAFTARIRDVSQPNPPDFVTVIFDGDRDQRLAFRLPTDHAAPQ